MLTTLDRFRVRASCDRIVRCEDTDIEMMDAEGVEFDAEGDVKMEDIEIIVRFDDMEIDIESSASRRKMTREREEKVSTK